MRLHLRFCYAKYSKESALLPVGGDAHIAPVGMIEFALDLHKIGLYRRVDVGIDPYALIQEIL